MVVFLASQFAGYITGEWICIDGGKHRAALSRQAVALPDAVPVRVIALLFMDFAAGNSALHSRQEKWRFCFFVNCRCDAMQNHPARGCLAEGIVR